MKKSFVLALKLLLIAGVSALVLAFVNSVTLPVIQERQNKEIAATYGEFFADGDEYNQLEDSDALNDHILEIVEVKKGGSPIGYVFTVLTDSGYDGPIKFMIGTKPDGEVTGLKILEHTETKGFGAKIEDQAYIDGVVGKMFNQALVASTDPKEDFEVSAVAGATFTTNAMLGGYESVVEALSKVSSDVGPVDLNDKPKVEEKQNHMTDEELEKVGATGATRLDAQSLGNENLIDVYKKEDGNFVAHIQSKGFAGNMRFAVTVDPEGTIVDYKVLECNESDGYGDAILGEKYRTSVIGKSVTEPMKATAEAAGANEIMAISGATFTTEGMEKGFNALVETFPSFADLPEASQEGDGETTGEGEGPSDSSKLSDEDLASVMSDVDSFTLMETDATNENVRGIYEAKMGEELRGYVFDVITPKGFIAPIEFILGTDLEGNIVGYKVLKVEDSEDYGDKVASDAYKQALMGKSVAAPLKAVENPQASDEIMAISGATFTTDAMSEGFAKVVEAFGKLQ